MSNAFLDFTTQCGIERQHTVRARPQQNGVAERANRGLSEHLTTMLDESGLPKAFWGECLAALVHVWNQCPTEAVRSATPYELWHGRKPDVSYLQVWGVLPMSTFRRTRELVLDRIWRNVYSLAILKDIRAGSSIILQPRRLSLLKE